MYNTTKHQFRPMCICTLYVLEWTPVLMMSHFVLYVCFPMVLSGPWALTKCDVISTWVHWNISQKFRFRTYTSQICHVQSSPWSSSCSLKEISLHNYRADMSTFVFETCFIWILSIVQKYDLNNRFRTYKMKYFTNVRPKPKMCTSETTNIGQFQHADEKCVFFLWLISSVWAFIETKLHQFLSVALTLQNDLHTITKIKKPTFSEYVRISGYFRIYHAYWKRCYNNFFRNYTSTKDVWKKCV